MIRKIERGIASILAIPAPWLAQLVPRYNDIWHAYLYITSTTLMLLCTRTTAVSAAVVLLPYPAVHYDIPRAVER